MVYAREIDKTNKGTIDDVLRPVKSPGRFVSITRLGVDYRAAYHTKGDDIMYMSEKFGAWQVGTDRQRDQAEFK